MEAFMAHLRMLQEQFVTLCGEDQENALAALTEAIGAMRYASVRHRFEREVELTLAWEAEKMIVERITSDSSSSFGAYDNTSLLEFGPALTSFQDSKLKENGIIWSNVYDKGANREESVLSSMSPMDEVCHVRNLESTALSINDTREACDKTLCAGSSWGNEIGKENRLKCATCGFLANNRKALYRHGLKTRHPLRVANSFGSVACRFCSFRTNRVFNYNRHMRRFHSHERWDLLENVPTTTTHHVLEETGPIAKTRNRCIGCYKNLAKDNDSRTAAKRAKKSNTRCSQCKKHFCSNCFNNIHRKCQLSSV